MITNERQYRITKAAAKRFEKAIAAAENEAPLEGVHPRLQRAMVDAMCSQLDDLRGEVREYDALRLGRIRRRTFSSLAEIPIALIEGRIARRLTQKELAKRVGLHEQQIQRYEANRYAGASLERLQEIADAIGIRLGRTVEYDVPASPPRTAATTAGRTTRKSRPAGARPSAATSKASKRPPVD